MTTRTALITGVSRGFGRTLAEDLVADGWRVVGDSRGGEHPAGVIGIRGDVTVARHRHDLVAACDGRIDFLVNNAGALGPSPQPALREYPIPEIAAVFEANVFAPLALLQQALPSFRAHAGAVVNITSDAAVEAYEGWGGYGSSKAALDQLTRVLAEEEPGLAVYSFDPGDMRTQMHQDAFPGEDISDRPLPETVVPVLRRLLRDAPPSGRFRAADLRPVTP